MATSIDGKSIVNTLYHSGVVTLLTVGYAELGKKLLKTQQPRAALNMNDIGMLTIDILFATSTKDVLVKNNIIPADIMK